MALEYEHSLSEVGLAQQGFADFEKSSCASPTSPSLARSDVHVWRIALAQTEAVHQKLRATLSEDEQRRAAQFKFEKLQKRFVTARGALRDILSRYTGLAAEKIAFEYEARGKPKLAETINHNGVCFNLAHTENLALCAVTCGRPVGVDVEFIRRLDDAERIARRFFSPRESAAFCALPPEQQPVAFFNCWTRKEAFIKALGEGLSHPLNQFEVSFVEGEPAALLCTRPDPREATLWTLQALHPAPNYAGALVVAGNHVVLKHWQWQAP